MKRVTKPKGASVHPSRSRSTPAAKRREQAPGRTGKAERPQPALGRSRAWLTGLLDRASEVILAVDEQHRILLFNKAAEASFGYEAQEVMGQPLALLLPERYGGKHEQHIEQFAAGAEPAHSRKLGRRVVGQRKNGTEFPLDGGISKATYRGQTFFTFIGTDLTERQLVEEARADERNLLRTLIDNLPDAVYVKDRESRFVLKNLADAHRMGAATPEEAIGKTDFDYYPAELAARYLADDRAVIESGLAIVDREEPVVEADGRMGWVSTTKVPLRDRQGNVIGLVGIGHDVTERRRAEDELQRRVEQFARLYEAGLALTRPQEPRALVEALLNTVGQALHAERAEFFEYDPENQCLRLTMATGYADETVLAALGGQTFPLGQPEGLVGWVGQERWSLVLNDTHADPRWVPLDPNIGSAMLVPLLHDGRLLGVFEMLKVQRDGFSADDRRLLELFAAQAAVALVNARLLQETQQRLAEMEAVNQVSAAMRTAPTVEQMLNDWLDLTLAAMGAHGGSIWLYERSTDTLRPAVLRGWSEPLGAGPVQPQKATEGVKGHVFTTGQPYVSADFKTDPHTAVDIRERIPAGGGACVPIRVAERIIGTFVIEVPLARLVTPGEVRLLSILSEIAGAAMQRTALHEETERRLQHLVALREIDQAINSSFDLQISLATLLGHTVMQLGADAADVLVFNPTLLLLEYSAGQGFRTPAPHYTSLRLGEGYAGRAALERSLVQVTDLAAYGDDPRLARALAGEGFASYFAVPLIAKGLVKGVLEVFRRTPLAPDADWLDMLHTLAGQGAIAIDNDDLFRGLQHSNTELALAYDATIEGWSHALDLRDKETEGHTQRVAETTVRLAVAFGLREEELAQVRWGALLHDIGKMGVPDSILLKPGPLTEAEWVVMRQHPTFAYEMLAPIRYLRSALDIPYCHHEKWDGTGYPRGLRREEIPVAARLFAVVDVWDALTSDRPYRAAWAEADVREHIRALAGTHFDPEIARLALESGLLVKRGSGGDDGQLSPGD